MSKKICLFLSVLFISLLVNMGYVHADYCTDCAANNGGRCGLCGYSCAVNSETGVCEINKNYTSSDQKKDENETYDNFKEATVSCGDGYMTNIPSMIPKVVKIAYSLIQILVPIILVIMGSLDLFKGITAQKEDEMKKGQQMFIKRLISAAIIFFVFAIVKIVVSVASDNSGKGILDCVECFIENKCDGD